MKCENCKIEMIEGSLFSNGQVWIDRSRMTKIGRWFLNPSGKNTVVAWKCGNCGKIDLRVEKMA